MNKLSKKLKHGEPSSLTDLSNKINKETKELTQNTNDIFKKVRKLVNRINDKDKRILKLKNQLETEKSISFTKVSNNKETYEINRKNIQKRLDECNEELNRIKRSHERTHRILRNKFNRLNITDKTKIIFIIML